MAHQYDIDLEYLYQMTLYPPKLPKCLLDPSNLVSAKDQLSKHTNSTQSSITEEFKTTVTARSSGI